MKLDIHNSNLPILCRACEARHKGICGALAPSELQQLAKHTLRKEVDRGTELVAAGTHLDRYANILSGVVKLTKLMADGRQQIVGLQFAPDFMGRPFADSGDITAEAASTVRICSFPRAELEQMTHQSPALERRLHNQSLRELDDARDWMLTLGRKTAAEKVASFLLLLSQYIDPNTDTYSEKFDIPLTRSDIADFLGLTIETVSRHITRLRKSDVISIENTRTVTICNFVGLQKAAAH